MSSRLISAVTSILDPKLVEELVKPHGEQLTATEMAAVQDEHGFVARRIAEQIVSVVRNALAADPRHIEAMCMAHDTEQAAQMGEPSPWGLGEDDPEWRSERRTAMLCALQAVGLA